MTETEKQSFDEFTTFLQENPKFEDIFSEYIPDENIREIDFDEKVQEQVDHMLEHMVEFAEGSKESYRAFFYVPDQYQATKLIHFEYSILQHMTGLSKDHTRESAVIELAKHGILLSREAYTFPNGSVHGVNYVAYRPGEEINGKLPVIIPEKISGDAPLGLELVAPHIGKLSLSK